MQEHEFIDFLKSGSDAAFQQLLKDYKVRVINTCYKFLLSIEDAEDIAQEVFIEVYQSIREFKGEASLSTWIYRIAVTKSLDEIKKRKRKKRITSIGKLIGLENIAEILEGSALADSNIKQKEEEKQILSALNKLPNNQRVAYTLSKVDGFSNAEISIIMNTSMSSVESLIKRAKKKMIEQLQKNNSKK